MSVLQHLLFAMAVLVPTAAHAEWRAANATVTEAAKNPRIAAVLAMANTMDTAILARDVAGFGAIFADDAVINNPFNEIADKVEAMRKLKVGLINYTSLHRSIEYAAVRGTYDVVLMGEETLTPIGDARFAGKTARRRTTEIWTDASGSWKLAIRQATVFEAK